MTHDWTSPASLVEQTRVYAAFVLVLAGVAGWEFLLWLPFDARLLFVRRKFRWPMLLYFACRISMVLHIAFFALNLNTLYEIPCQGVIWVSKVTDMTGTVSASAILALRSHAVWGRHRVVGAVLLAGLLAQLALWLTTFRYSRSEWDPARRFCRIVATAPNDLIIGVFSWTMGFDFVILSLAAYSLWPDRGAGGISALLLRDGIGYFAAVFAANGVAAVFAALRRSPVLNIMGLPFALVVSTLSAAVVFRRVLAAPDGWAGPGAATGASVPRFARPKPAHSSAWTDTELATMDTARPPHGADSTDYALGPPGIKPPDEPGHTRTLDHSQTLDLPVPQ